MLWVQLSFLFLCIVTQHASASSSWEHFKLMQQHETYEILEYYVIILEPGSIAEIHCDSRDLIPQLTQVDSIEVEKMQDSVPQEQMIAGYSHAVKVDEPCKSQVSEDMRFPGQVNSCSYRVSYTIHNVWWDCHFRDDRRTNIRLVTTPKRVPYKYSHPPTTNHMDWWCLRDYNITFAEAGHLLWVHWGTRSTPSRLLVVQRFASWELEPGDMFECNGTVWQWGSDYSCLHILPSGWPALVHCHGSEQFFMILGIILFFMFIYANGVAAYNTYQYARHKTKEAVAERFTRNQLVNFPMIVKHKHRPYSNMPDISILQKKPTVHTID